MRINGKVGPNAGLSVPTRFQRCVDEFWTSSIVEERLGIVPSKLNLQHPKIDELAKILGMTRAELDRQVKGAKRFFWISKNLNLEQAHMIRALRIPGLELETDYRRFYPFGEAFAHVVGFTDAEERGAEGLERTHDEGLKGVPGQTRLVVDRRNTAVGERPLLAAAPGKDLQVSLDASLQTIAQGALKNAMLEHKAKAASAVVVDVQTGEVLALANEPSFDPNDRKGLNANSVRNRAVTDAFEPGSTMKAFSIAAAIELGRVTPSTTIQTSPGKITIGNRTIGDTQKHGLLSVQEILAKSSNVGTVKIAQQLQSSELYDFYVAAGFGRVPDVGLNGATSGRLRAAKNWVPIEKATISYGHGVSVSLLQLARAYTIFARDGDLVPLSFVPQPGPVAGVRVISPNTAKVMRDMLEQATSPTGTAPKAQVMGFRVAGKTGTAHKPEAGGYAKNKYISSFVGFAPADRPRFVIAVMVDEPSGGKHYAGEVAAPVFSQIANDALRRLQMSPNPSLRILPAVALIAEGSQ
jgi:cell division protein FtsI (penicillin-binding protein 3)